jgi:uncharacterized protein (TIGR00369 family)
VPTLLLHGDDDQIVPIDASARSCREAGAERGAEGLRWGRPRHLLDPEGPGRSRSARLPAGAPLTTDVHGAIEFSVVERSADHVVGVMPVRAGILNPHGVVHAGALLWFADVCATVLALGGADPAPGQARFPLAIDLHAAFLSNQRDGALEARARFVKRGRRVSVVRTTVSGAGGRILADVTTTHVPAA